MRTSTNTLVSYIIVLLFDTPTSMIPEYKELISFRLSTKERQRIEQLIQEGKFKNISEVVRAALREFLSKEGDWRHD